MLLLSEFFAGHLADAPIGSLVLPRSKYEHLGIVCSANDEPFFVVLSAEHGFRGFHSKGNKHHKGIVVPNVQIEVDESAIRDPDSRDIPLGAIVARNGVVGIYATHASGGFGSTLVAGILDTAATGVDAAFTAWQIVIGRGSDKRILHRTDVGGVVQN